MAIHEDNMSTAPTCQTSSTNYETLQYLLIYNCLNVNIVKRNCVFLDTEILVEMFGSKEETFGKMYHHFLWGMGVEEWLYELALTAIGMQVNWTKIHSSSKIV